MRLPPFTVLLLWGLTSCGEDPPTSFETFEEACAVVEGCGSTVATEDIWVVEVVRDVGEFRIGSVERGQAPLATQHEG